MSSKGLMRVVPTLPSLLLAKTSKLTISTFNYSTSLLLLLRAVTYRYCADHTTEENVKQERKLAEATLTTKA
jgi:hypothetical protein